MDSRTFVIGRDPVPSYIRLGAGEAVRWTVVVLPGCSGERLCLEVDLDGEGADLDLAGLYLCSGDDRVDIRVTVRHNSAGCESRQLFKGIAGGRARAGFDGLVYVAHGAGRTRSAQENHSILLGADARVESRPQLEIYADDVECSHGATTGFLSADELFYMRSRGIPEHEARRLQMISFLAPVLERLPEDISASVSERMEQFFDDKLPEHKD